MSTVSKIVSKCWAKQVAFESSALCYNDIFHYYSYLKRGFFFRQLNFAITHVVDYPICWPSLLYKGCHWPHKVTILSSLLVYWAGIHFDWFCSLIHRFGCDLAWWLLLEAAWYGYRKAQRFCALGTVLQALILFGSARFIAWGATFWGECRQGSMHFWNCQTCVSYGPAPDIHNKKALCQTRTYQYEAGFLPGGDGSNTSSFHWYQHPHTPDASPFGLSRGRQAADSGSNQLQFQTQQ